MECQHGPTSHHGDMWSHRGKMVKAMCCHHSIPSSCDATIAWGSLDRTDVSWSGLPQDEEEGIDAGRIATSAEDETDTAMPGCGGFAEEGIYAMQHEAQDSDKLLAVLDAIDDILRVGQSMTRDVQENNFLEITVDFGAADVVASPGLAPKCQIKPAAGSRSAAKHRKASGNAIANQGEKKVTLKTEPEELRAMTFQIANITPTLASARCITA